MGKLKVLITGGKGNVGSHIALKFLDGAELQGQQVEPVLFDNLSTGHRTTLEGECQFIEGDLKKPADLRRAFEAENFDLVYHCGAALSVPESVTDPQKYAHNNIIGSINLADAMIEHNVKNLVFSGTAAACGTPDKVPIDESIIPNPINPYGNSKVAVENVFLDYANAYGFNVVIFRYFNVAANDPKARLGEHHTPNEGHLIPRAILDIIAGNPITIFGGQYEIPEGEWTDDGTCVRDYIHMVDLMDLHMLGGNEAIEGVPHGQNIYHGGSRTGYSVKEVVQECVNQLAPEEGHKIWIAAARAGDPPILVADSSAARELLNWNPRHALTDMVKHAGRFFKTRPDIVEEWRSQRAKELESYLDGSKQYTEELWTPRAL